jgi:hypothetical protein
MKKTVISGAVVIVLGLLISLGPQFLFKVCGHGESGFPLCHWSARAETGIGLLIVALGVCMIVFTNPKTHRNRFSPLCESMIYLFVRVCS